MAYELRRKNLDFIARAPAVHVAEGEIAAPRAAVFTAFTDAPGWKHWFPSVREASYTTPPPHGVGSIREADVGATRWVEEIIAWDAPTRWAWTVVSTSVPFATAQVESFEFMDGGTGTRVRWTIALEPRLIARLGAPFFGRTLVRMLDRALGNLSARLGAR